MPKGTQLNKDGQGGLEDPTSAGAPPADAPTQVDDGFPEGFDPDNIEAITQAGLKMSKATKAKVAGALNKAAKRLAALAQAVTNAEEGEGNDVPASLTREIATVARVLNSMVPKASDGEQKKDDDDFTPDTAGTPDASKADPIDPDAIAAEAATITEAHKAGRKISANRLAQLRQAQDLLAELLADVDPKPDAPEPANTNKAATDTAIAALQTQITELTKSSHGLAQVVRAQAQQLQKMRGTHPAPNSGSPADSMDVDSASGWPLNFNDPEPTDEDRF